MMTPLRLGAPGAPVKQPMTPGAPAGAMIGQRPLNQPMPQTSPMGGMQAQAPQMGPGMTPETQMLRAPMPQQQAAQAPAARGMVGPAGAASQAHFGRMLKPGGKMRGGPAQFRR
jgi:hypothetical protein